MRTGWAIASGLALALLATPAGAVPKSAIAAAATIDRDAEPERAIAAWEALLPRAKGAERGRILWNLAAARLAASQSGPALALLDEARPLLTAAEDRARLATSRGTALADLNRLDEAEASFREAVSLWHALRPAGSPQEADALEGLAVVAFGRGDLEEAKRRGAASVAMFRASGGTDRPEFINAIGNMSGFHLQSRELEASEAAAREALAIANRTLAADHPTTIIALNNWVAVLAAQNRRDEAVESLQRIAALREKRFGPEYPPLAITYNNLSRNLMFLKRSPEAEPFARRAVAIGAKTRGADDQALAAFRDNLADILDENGKTDESIAMRREAIAGLGAKGSRARVMRIRGSLGTTLAERGDSRGALLEFQAVTAFLAETKPEDNPDRIDAETNLATVEARLGLPGAGDRMRRQLALVERNLFAAGDPGRRATTVARLLEHLLEVAWSTGDRASGFRVAQLMALDPAGQAISAVAMRTAANSDSGRALVRRRQDLLSARDRQTKAALAAFAKGDAAYRDAAAAVVATDAALAETEQALGRAFPGYARFARFAPLGEGEVAARLRPEQALVMPAPLGTGAVTFVVRRDGADWAKSPEGVDVAQEVAAVRASLGGAGEVRGAVADATVAGFDPARAHALYRALIPTRLEPRLKGSTAWLVSAGGTLSALPFAVLVTEPPAAGRTPWLIRRAALETVPSLAGINAAPATRTASDRFVGIGAPALSGSASPGALRGFYRGGSVNRDALAALAPLPQAASELKRMESALPRLRPTILTGAAATESAVKAGDLTRISVLAFATHGLVGGAIDAGSEPGLVMTPPATATPADDGLLTASEIAALDIDADWVVLSACDTAAGDRPDAPALSGLARAFLYAGARSLLVSHWAVRDDVAARLTVETATLAAQGQDRAQALRHAMLRLIDDKRVPGAADPAVWAPFILVSR